MALKVGSVSIQHEADADFELTCTPCGEDKIREEAVKYCSECDEFLCQTCTRHHGRQKATRSHQLQDKSVASRGLLMAAAAKCQYHPDRDIDMYCGTHDMVYCWNCITIEHRSSCDVKSINGKLCSSGQETGMKDLRRELEKIKAELTVTKENKEINVGLVERQKDDCLTAIHEIENKLSYHIQKLKRDTTKSVQLKSAELGNEHWLYY